MKEEMKTLHFDKYEIGILINSINEYRNKTIKENKDTECLDELLLKVIDAPIDKKKNKGGYIFER